MKKSYCYLWSVQKCLFLGKNRNKIGPQNRNKIGLTTKNRNKRGSLPRSTDLGPLGLGPPGLGLGPLGLGPPDLGPRRTIFPNFSYFFLFGGEGLFFLIFPIFSYFGGGSYFSYVS